MCAGKKKEHVIAQAQTRETEAALSLIRKHATERGQIDFSWVERSLLDAARKDAAKTLEGLLHTELPALIDDHELSADERFHSYRTRTIESACGPLTLKRAYYLGDKGGRYPLDEALQLHRRYTPAVVDLICWAGAMDASFDVASETLQRFAGLSIPGRQIQRVINELGEKPTEWMQQRVADKLHEPVGVLNIQCDMTGVPMRPEETAGVKGKQPDGTAKTKQVKVGCVFTQTKDKEGKAQRDPFSTTYTTAFTDRVEFADMLWQEALKRGYATAKKRVFIGDGADWIWNIAQERFSDAVQIVDFYHACEHLHELCKIIEPDPERIKALFKKWRKRLKHGRLEKLLHEIEQRADLFEATIKDEVLSGLEYFRKNKERMRYRTFRQRGYFIGSGAVEGACRHVVAQRTKLSGMRWLKNGAEHVLAFRSLIKSGYFDDYCTRFRSAA